VTSRAPRKGGKPRSDPKQSDRARPERKDRLIQARVPQDLESTVKAEAERRRLSVSHLIRSVLEDAFDLVDDVVSDVDQIVSDSVHLARNVGRNARRLASPGQRAEPVVEDALDDLSEAADQGTGRDLSHVAAWNEVMLNRPIPCSSCGGEIARGTRGFVGLSDDPGSERAWLCTRCIDDL